VGKGAQGWEEGGSYRASQQGVYPDIVSLDSTKIQLNAAGALWLMFGVGHLASSGFFQVIARAGLASRRKAEELITEGLVKVNGHKILVPQHQVTAGQDKVGSAYAPSISTCESQPGREARGRKSMEHCLVIN
jgi:hypothetical protein